MDEILLAQKNINILSIVPEGDNRGVVVFEYQWRNYGKPIWSKDFIRITIADDNDIRGLVAERVLELRKTLESGVKD